MHAKRLIIKTWFDCDHSLIMKIFQYKLKSHILAGQYVLSHQHQHSGRECSNTVEGWKFHAQNVLIPNITHHIKRKKTCKKIAISEKSYFKFLWVASLTKSNHKLHQVMIANLLRSYQQTCILHKTSSELLGFLTTELVDLFK